MKLVPFTTFRYRLQNDPFLRLIFLPSHSLQPHCLTSCYVKTILSLLNHRLLALYTIIKIQCQPLSIQQIKVTRPCLKKPRFLLEGRSLTVISGTVFSIDQRLHANQKNASPNMRSSQDAKVEDIDELS